MISWAGINLFASAEGPGVMEVRSLKLIRSPWSGVCRQRWFSALLRLGAGVEGLGAQRS